MDLINRYVYAVTKSLPMKQRMDIEKELRTIIDDMLGEYDDQEPYDTRVEKVLKELGDPEALADNYRGSKRYLIGPQYFDLYLLVLKIALGAVFVAVSIGVLFAGIFSEQKSISDLISGYISAAFSGVLQAAAWVTIVFAIIERNQVKLDRKVFDKNQWSPFKLQPIPEKKAIIPLSEPIVSIIFTTIFMVLLYSYPQLFAAYILDNGVTTRIPVLNLEVINDLRGWILCVFALNIMKDGLKLFFRRWTLKLSSMVILLNVVSTIIFVAIFTNPSIWNPEFTTEVISNMKLTFDFAAVWGKIKTGILVLAVVGAAIDAISTLVKGIRYNTSK